MSGKTSILIKEDILMYYNKVYQQKPKRIEDLDFIEFWRLLFK